MLKLRTVVKAKNANISTALNLYINCWPELGLENKPNTALVFEPASELLGSTSKTIIIIRDDIRNQLLSSKLMFKIGF